MSGDSEAGDDFAFLRDSLDSLADRRLLLPTLLLVALLAAGKVALMANLPSEQDKDHLLYLIAFLVVTLGMMAFIVAILRILNRSVRPPWQPDLSVLLYGLALIASTAIGLAADFAVGGTGDLLGGLAAAALSAVVRVPLAVWFVAIAVEGPLAWNPGPWLRSFRLWLPALLLWSLLIVAPLSQLLLILNQRFLTIGADWYWPAALVDAPLAVAAGLVSLALASTAYRRVARS